MFLFCKKGRLLLLFVQLPESSGKSWNFAESPGKVLEKVKKSPGKSWNSNHFFLVETMKLLLKLQVTQLF